MSQAILTNSTKPRPGADSFAKSVVLIGVLMVAQRGIGFLRSFYVCGVLSPSEIGQWDLAFSFLMLIAPLAVLGIPGSFGRYVGHYEKRNLRGRFLRQTFLVCIGLMFAAAIAIHVFRIEIARVVFGNEADKGIVSLLAIGLPVVVLFNFTTCWFTGTRLNRIVLRIQLVQSLFFAVICVFALHALGATGKSVIVAYLLSCLFGLILALSYMFLPGHWSRQSVGLADENSIASGSSIWKKILPFAAWVWMSNALINLFAACDRLLLVNFLPTGGVDVQSLIGQYHTSRIFPLLLLAVGAMAGSMMTPYVSKDWEAGKRESVNDQFNLILKSIGLLCLSLALGVMTIAPMLFEGIWRDKFQLGESLLPLTLAYCSLAAMTLVAQKYFWCLEKIWYSSLILLMGLMANLFLGLAWIDAFGIVGVVSATLVSHVIVLGSVLYFCRRNGLRIDIGVLAVFFALTLICLGSWAVIYCWMALMVLTIFSTYVFNASEKDIISAKAHSICSRILGAGQ